MTWLFPWKLYVNKHPIVWLYVSVDSILAPFREYTMGIIIQINIYLEANIFSSHLVNHDAAM